MESSSRCGGRDQLAFGDEPVTCFFGGCERHQAGYWPTRSVIWIVAPAFTFAIHALAFWRNSRMPIFSMSLDVAHYVLQAEMAEYRGRR